MRNITIQGRSVGAGEPCFVIAEIGVNHNGDLALAKQLIDVAAQAGADCVKFQVFHADSLVGPNAPLAPYQGTDRAIGQSEMLRGLQLEEADWMALKRQCDDLGITFLATPFDEESLDLLMDLSVAALKVGSGDLTNPDLLRAVGSTHLPVILSTGMATMEEVDHALGVLDEVRAGDVLLLHCVSAYPADPVDANLRAMRSMSDQFQLSVGFSDHTLGIEVALAAVALGACVIEKHITINNTLPGPDHRASLTPPEFASLVKGIRTVEMSLGTGRKEPAAAEADVAAVARRSLTAARDLPAGHVLESRDIAVQRPGIGLKPALKDELVGKRVRKSLTRGSLFSLDLLE